MDIYASLLSKEKTLRITSTSNLASSHLDATINESTIIIHYKEVQNVQIRYYKIDPEVMFSFNPFMKPDKNSFTMVMAALT